MAGSRKSDFEYRAEVRQKAKRAGEPIDDDSVIVVSHDLAGNPVVDSITPIWRPAEKLSDPIKSRWSTIWVIIVVLVVLVWLLLYWYFSSHQVSSAAPLGLSSRLPSLG